MLNKIMYATVYVTDQDRALEFYTEGLGLEKRLDFPGPDGRFLTVGVPDSPVQTSCGRMRRLRGSRGKRARPVR
ncbi:VOC family protein [Streptomyces albidoflavus]|uniref:VOC family protein n=1 Tax=Streptomyces koyangensis TaxID=188770 RepID=UPI003D008680|nr:VOC family protein [Streptomyces albidoflavus]